MRFLKSIAVTALLLLSGLGLAAQTRTVSGKVIDATGQPVPGVGVVVDGTTNGTMTAMDGSWSLRIPSGDAVLNFSSLGYVTQSVKVGAGQSTVNVTMEEDNMVLEETIVVGYGTQKKVNLTGAVTAVESKELENRASHNLTNMLQGQVPGLNITTSKGQPGAAGSLNIRGYTSINGGDPLVLVDGVESDMSMVNPNDVESISVIKDASAAAVYGTRGAWGVILITTKSGKDEEGNAVVTYSGRMGWE
ncbi:MAG: TonB-dependent receptor plug domain-containing protein, partial [Bacteroidales bacterium]|nr:TonB-dependent receptor plug domain-containing protein [Bacteroidales bacterium]